MVFDSAVNVIDNDCVISNRVEQKNRLNMPKNNILPSEMYPFMLAPEENMKAHFSSKNRQIVFLSACFI